MTLTAYGSLLHAAQDDRTLTYRLLPYGEEGRTSAGRVTASPGRLTLPAAASELVGNLEHDEVRPISRGTHLVETDDGLDLTVRVLPTSAGDDLLVEATEGVRSGISVEITDPVIRDGALIGGHLSGYGHVCNPAFPSAQLAASDIGDLPEDFPAWLTPATSDTVSTETVNVDGRTYQVTTTHTSTTSVEEITAPGTSEGTTEGDSPERKDAAMATTASIDKTVEDEITDDTQDEQEETVETEEQKKATAAAAHASPLARVMAGGVAAAKATLTAAKAQPLGLTAVARQIATAHQRGGKAALAAALSDITPADILGIEQPQYLGELWSGKAHVRRIIPLFNHADLTSYKLTGWRWKTKPEVEAYAGGKAAVPSAEVETEAVDITAKRLAGAHDIDRKFRDFNDSEFFAAYFRAMTESYSKKSDGAVLADALAAATAITQAAAPVGSTLAQGIVCIVDGALKVLTETDAAPTFAVVASNLYRDILLTPRDQVLGYLSAALGFEEGDLEGFKIIAHKSMTANKVLVGTKEAVTVHELPGSPIRVDAIDIVNGGVDEGLFGYYATNVHDAGGLALVTAAA